MAEGATAALDEAQIGQLDVALLTAETARMPVLVHRLDDSADDEFAAFAAAWCEQHLKVVLAVLASLELEKCAVFEYLKALGASANQTDLHLNASARNENRYHYCFLRMFSINDKKKTYVRLI